MVLKNFLIFILSVHYLFSQSNYRIPKELIIYKNAKLTSGEGLIYSNPPIVYNDRILPTFSLSRIFPIGWSADGNFAYLYHPSEYSNESGIAVGYKLNILNLKTNKTITLGKYSDVDELYNHFQLKDVWNKNIKEINKLLINFKIVQYNNIDLQLFPIIIQDDPFSDEEKIYLNTLTLLKDSTGLSQNIKYALHSTLKGNKIIKDETFPYAIFHFDSKILGYLPSPNRKHIVLIEQFTSKGSCGTIPRDLNFAFIGAQIESGFTK